MMPVIDEENRYSTEDIKEKPSRRQNSNMTNSTRRRDGSLADSSIHKPTISPSNRSSSIAAATHAEHSMTLREGVRLYPKAITWSILLSMTLVMEGYSTILVPNLYALEPFKRKFGNLQFDGSYEISAAWQSAIVNGALGGQILGLFVAGTLAERIGYRFTLMVGLTLISFFVFIPFFAENKLWLLVGQCLLGAPWGMFQCISTVYAADVCPVALRAYLTTYVSCELLFLFHYLFSYFLPMGVANHLQVM